MLKSGTTVFVGGYRQVSPANQDPVLIRFDGGKKTFCRTDFETSPADGRIYGLFLSGESLYVLFSMHGTQGAPERDLRRFTRKGWMRDAGRGAPTAAVILRMDPKSGDAQTGTFLTAVKDDGNSNSVEVLSIENTAKGLVVKANAWHSPRMTSRAPMQCTGASPFLQTIIFTPDLSRAVDSSAQRCVCCE